MSNAFPKENCFNLYLPNNNNSLYYYSFTQFTQSSKSLAISSSPPPSLQIRQLIFRRLGNLLKISEPRNSKAHVKVSSLDSKASGLFKISCFDHVLFFFLKTLSFPLGFKVFYRIYVTTGSVNTYLLSCLP